MAGKFKQGLVGLVLLGATSGLGGCGAVVGAIGMDNAAHVRGRYEVRAAEILANAQQNNYLKELAKKYSFFTCNYWKDMNNDNMIQREVEFVGFKDSFSTDEKITFVGCIRNRSGSDIFFELYNQNNEVVGTNRVRTETDIWYTAGFVYEPNTLSPGNYVGIWSTKDKTFLGKKEINIFKP